MTTKEQYISAVINYLEENKDRYTELERSLIKTNAAWGMNTPYTHELLRQIYEETGIQPEEKSMYNAFCELLEKQFTLEQDIIEVAGGIIPSLSKKIALKQKKGTITVYDPRLIGYQTDIPNLILKPKEFNEHTPLKKAKMLIGFMPCDATNMIIETACENGLDFMVALCEGGNRKGYEFLEYDDEWISHVKSNALRKMQGTNLGVLKEASLEQFDNPFPIIYNKRIRPSDRL